MANDSMRYFDTSKRTKDARVAGAALPAEQLAESWDAYLPDSPQKSIALRKLLEAKDAACRASLNLFDESGNAGNPPAEGCCCQSADVKA